MLLPSCRSGCAFKLFTFVYFFFYRKLTEHGQYLAEGLRQGEKLLRPRGRTRLQNHSIQATGKNIFLLGMPIMKIKVIQAKSHIYLVLVLQRDYEFLSFQKLLCNRLRTDKNFKSFMARFIFTQNKLHSIRAKSSIFLYMAWCLILHKDAVLVPK